MMDESRPGMRRVSRREFMLKELMASPAGSTPAGSLRKRFQPFFAESIAMQAQSNESTSARLRVMKQIRFTPEKDRKHLWML